MEKKYQDIRRGVELHHWDLRWED